MTRKGNIVLTMPPGDSSIFSPLQVVSDSCVQAGLGRLVYIGNIFIDEYSLRHEFMLESGSAGLMLHDDFDLGLRYISVNGEAIAVKLLVEQVKQHLSYYSLEDLLGCLDRDVEKRPEWLNGVALASESPAPESVLQAIAAHLNSCNEEIAFRAVEAAFLIGAGQFSHQLDELKIHGFPSIKKMLELLQY